MLRIEDIGVATPLICTKIYVKFNIFSSPYHLFSTFFQTFCIFAIQFTITNKITFNLDNKYVSKLIIN